MKTVLASALMLLLGLFLGGLPPRFELRRVQKELVEARSISQSYVPALPLDLGIFRNRTSVPRFVKPQQASGEDGDDDDTVPQEHPDAAPSDAKRHRGWPLGDPKTFEAARVAADLRAAQFRTAFLEEAHLNPEQQAAFESTIKTMNGELAKAAGEAAETLKARGTAVKIRDMADLGARMLDVYRRADDDLGKILGPEAAAAKEKTRFDMMTQADLSVLRDLGELGKGLDRHE